MDPGTVVGIVSLGIQVCQGLISYYSACKSYQDVPKTLDRVAGLLSTLSALQKVVTPSSEANKDIENSVLSAIAKCKDNIETLQAKLTKIQPHPQNKGQGLRQKFQAPARIMLYPFRESTLAKLRELVSETRDDLAPAIGALQLNEVNDMRHSIEDIHGILSSMQRNYQSQEIQAWLQGLDHTPKLQSAAKKREGLKTGSWFTGSNRFSEWVARSNSLLWLFGMPGCGKTVLCSTIVHHVLRLVNRMKDSAVAFFFFTFSDSEAQRPESLLQSVLSQLCGQCKETPNFTELQKKYSAGAIPRRVLLQLLDGLLQKFSHVFVIVDALDECSDRYGLASDLNEIRSWQRDCLHVLVTGRPEWDVHLRLDHAASEELSIQVPEVDKDIAASIKWRLHSDHELRKWSTDFEMIRKSLEDGAQGMFRWVECQFVALKKCANRKSLIYALHNLPPSLDETYRRTLLNLEPDCIEQCSQPLRFLCFSPRPILICEAGDAVAVDVENAVFDPDLRIKDVQCLLNLCPDFVTTSKMLTKPVSRDTAAYDDYPSFKSVQKLYMFDSFAKDETAPLRSLQLAHYSVKEYLVSRLEPKDIPQRIYFTTAETYTCLANSCLIYLLQFQDPAVITEESMEQHPFAMYAAANWYRFAREANQTLFSADRAVELLTSKGPLLAWLRLHDPSSMPPGPNFTLSLDECASPLFYAMFLSNSLVFESLLKSHKMDAHKVYQRFLEFDHKSMVLGMRGMAFETAVVSEIEAFLKALIDTVMKTPKAIDDAIKASVACENQRFLEALIQRGVSPEKILYSAIQNERPVICMQMLGFGANLNVVHDGIQLRVQQSGPFDLLKRLTALRCAAYIGNETIIDQLLEAGAHVECQTTDQFSPLHIAASRGNITTTKKLLEAGANPKVPNSDGYLPFHLVLMEVALKPATVELLEALETEDCLSQELPAGDTCLHLLMTGLAEMLPSIIGDFSNKYVKKTRIVLHWLLDRGVPIDLTNSYGHSPLMIAAQSGIHFLIHMLLEAGASIQGQDSDGYSIFGHLFSESFLVQWGTRLLDALEMFLDRGAEPTASDFASNRALWSLIEHSEPQEFHLDRLVQSLVKNSTRDIGADSWSRAVMSAVKGRKGMILGKFMEAEARNSSKTEGPGFILIRFWRHALTIAVDKKDATSVQALLSIEGYSEVNQGEFPIWIAKAICGGDKTNLKMLLQSCDYCDEHVFHYLFQLEFFREDLLDMIFEFCASISHRALNNWVHFVDKWLQKIGPGAVGTEKSLEITRKILAKNSETALNWNNESALLVAARKGLSEIVSLLLSSGHDPLGFSNRDKDKDGNKRLETTPLLEAAAHGHLEIVKIITDYQGDSVVQKDWWGRTALHHTASSCHLEIAKFVISHQKDIVFQVDNEGETALHWAARYGHLELVKIIVGHQAETVFQSNEGGNTALHHAAGAGWKENVFWLVENGGANVQARNDEGQTALDRAIQVKDCLKTFYDETMKAAYMERKGYGSGGRQHKEVIEYLSKFKEKPKEASQCPQEEAEEVLSLGES